MPDIYEYLRGLRGQDLQIDGVVVASEFVLAECAVLDAHRYLDGDQIVVSNCSLALNEVPERPKFVFDESICQFTELLEAPIPCSTNKLRKIADLHRKKMLE